MSTFEQSVQPEPAQSEQVQPEQAGQDAQHPPSRHWRLSQRAAWNSTSSPAAQCTRQPLSKEAAVLILFGVLDNSPSTGGLTAAPKMSAPTWMYCSSYVPQPCAHTPVSPPSPAAKSTPEDYALAETTGEPVAHIAALREAVEETGLDPPACRSSASYIPCRYPSATSWSPPSSAGGTAPCPSKLSTTTSPRSSPVCPCATCSTPPTGTPPTSNAAALTPHPAFEVRMPGGKEFTVWGFTAILLDRIFDSLGWTVPWDQKKMRPAPGYEE